MVCCEYDAALNILAADTRRHTQTEQIKHFFVCVSLCASVANEKENILSSYRERIYQHYVHARPHSLAPATIDGLRPRKPYLEKIIRNHFPSDKDALISDLGCGHGALIYFAQKAGYTNIVGTDTSPEQVAEAKRLGIEGVHEGELMEALRSIPDNSHDVIIAFDVIEHFNKEELLPFVDEVYRVLRTGGKWIIHCPNGESPFASRMRYWDFTHEQAFTRTSLAQLLLASGFSEVNSYEDTPIPHGLKSLIRFVCWKGIRAVLRFWLAAETGGGEKECIFTQNFLTIARK